MTDIVNVLIIRMGTNTVLCESREYNIYVIIVVAKACNTHLALPEYDYVLRTAKWIYLMIGEEMLDFIQNLDVNILYFIQDNLRTPFLNEFMTHFTSLGNGGLIWITLTLLMLIYPKTRKAGACSAISIILCFLTVNLGIKNIVARTRPYDTYELVRCIIKPAVDYSFPSGHSAIAFATVLPIYFQLGKKWGIPFMLAALLMAASRLYVCVHYPSDVLCGMIFGVVCAVVACKLIYPRFIGEKINSQMQRVHRKNR